MSSDSYINVSDVRSNPALVAAKILTGATDKSFMATVIAAAKPKVEFISFANEWLATCPICGEAYWGETEQQAAAACQQHQQHVAECFCRDFDGAMFALRSRVSLNRRQDIDDCLPQWKEYGLQAGIDF